MRICSKCKLSLHESAFNNSNLKLNKPRCKLCLKAYKKIYYIKNKEVVLEKNKKYNQTEAYKQYKKNHYEENKEYYVEYKRSYYKENAEHIKRKVTEYKINRKNNDPGYMLKVNISKQVNIFLKKKSVIKGGSLIHYVGWSLEELYSNIESKFESWMNWENYGTYCKETWDDEDQSTWRWQLDHIVPHSTFNYLSMEDGEFKECWSLDNLRPYSSKQNILDGNRR